MKQTLKFILLISIAALLTGCKLAVIVVEGGEVKSDRSGTCMAGSVCIVEVTDTNFQDAFEPAPNAGWYFDSWSSGDRFFCGGSNDPVCILSLQEHTENKAIGEIVASSETFYLMPLFKQLQPNLIVVDGRTVKVEGREWLQPADFVNYSYNQLSEVCPDGMCSGTLPGSTIDLTGYNWASSDDILLLFKEYRKVDQVLLEDFEYTRLFYYPGGNGFAIDTILSDPPLERGSDVAIHVSFVVGDGIDSEPEIREIVEYTGDLDEVHSLGYGAWFWRPIE